MKTEMNEKQLTVFLEGHIDSANSGDIEAELFDILKANAPVSVVIDAERLEYISSAGLRIILKVKKAYNDLKIINVSSSVYEIFDVTGFTEIVEVQKAYRIFDITGCEIIGEGANGKVYRADRDTIVKVYKDADSLDSIKNERELARTAFIMGIPTAIPYDVVKVGDTYGSVFELLNAKSFCELMIEDPVSNLEFVAQESVKIAKIMHSTDAPEDLPKQSDEAKAWTVQVERFFSDERNNKLKALIDAIPETGKMLHGDYHIKNIMYQNNETLLIDMDTLCTGHPIYELAFMFNAYKGFGLVDKRKIEDFFKISTETTLNIWKRSLELYFDTDDEDFLTEIEKKASLIGYLRIMRRVIRMGEENTPDGSELIEACRTRMNELIDTLDTLTY